MIRHGPLVIGAGTVQTTWVDWYNTVATARDQERFDAIAREIDQAGLEALPGGSYAGIPETYRVSSPEIYQALVNYRDTGGRRALFAQKATNYGNHAISVIREGGPIEKIDGRVILHPGRYTYTDPVQNNPAAGRFREWLKAMIRDRKAQPIRTQVSDSILSGLGIVSPYYIDVEFLVAVDLEWPGSLPGLPTWLPAGEDVQSYWGKPSKSVPPDVADLADFWKKLKQTLENIATIAALLGIGYLLMLFGSRQPARST